MAEDGRRRRTKLLALALGLWAVLSAAAIAPQAASPFESVEVHLWPEYDRAAVLVIYRITLSAAAPLPTTVEVPIPADAGEPYAVAVRDADGQLLNAAYARSVAGEWATIAIEGTQRELQLEYYEDLIRNGTERRYTFTWPSGLSAASLAFEVQQPIGASGFALDPGGEGPQTGELGLLYHRVEIGAVSGTAAPTLSLRYEKASDALSMEASAASLPAGGTDSPSAVPASLTPWVLGGFGVLLIVAGGWWQVQRLRARTPARNRHRTGRRAGHEILPTAAVFCHSCGTEAGPGDRFCRQCGTRLRR